MPEANDFKGPTSGKGQNSEVVSRSRRVRSTPMNGHRQTGPTGPFRANTGSESIADHFVNANHLGR